MVATPGVYLAKNDGYWWRGPNKDVSWSGGGSSLPPAKVGYTGVLEEQFPTSTIDPRWSVYNNSNFGSTGGRIQTYMAANAVAGTGTTGATNGTSLKLTVLETDNGTGTNPIPGGGAGTRYSYTAGMLDSRTANVWYPRYGYYEFRAKTPHGQGIWPSFWLVAKNGGSGTAEIDIMEYFHAQIPGKNSSTIHALDNGGVTYHPNKYTNNGAAGNGTGGRTFFEAPTATPAWHIWAAEILPVTDATGNTIADPTQPSSYLRLRVFLDNVLVWTVVDTTALWYTTNGGTEDSFWNIFLQGAQIDSSSSWVGHPADTLGYAHYQNVCTISGSVGSCATTTGGYGIRRMTYDGVANVTEVDYVRVWKYTG